MQKIVSVLYTIILGLTLSFGSCNTINEAFEITENPYKQYKQALLESKLSGKEMVQQWIHAGDSALAHPVEGSLPLNIQLTYFKDNPIAYGWKFNIPAGRIFQAEVVQSDSSHQLFTELYSIEDGNLSFETSLEDSLLKFKPERSQTVILRVQPELLISGSIHLTVTDHPSLSFPVAGGQRYSIQSFWGDPRDGGVRQHEGVDIFTDRGTPAIAAAEGRIRRTGTTRRGGNIVWLRSNGLSLYYAHLDSILAFATQKVQAGDTLGLIGNTGNAKTTPPHLHFGIYDRGAVNPFPFIDEANTAYKPINLNQSFFGNWARVKASKANVRPIPSTGKPPIASIERNTPVKVLGGTEAWYYIELPSGQRAFIYNILLEKLSRPVQSLSVAKGDTLFGNFVDIKPLKILNDAANMDSFGTHKNGRLIKYKERYVWLKSHNLTTP